MYDRCETLKDVADRIYEICRVEPYQEFEIQYKDFQPVKVKVDRPSEDVYAVWVWHDTCAYKLRTRLWAWSKSDRTPLEFGIEAGVCECAEEFMRGGRSRIR